MHKKQEKKSEQQQCREHLMLLHIFVRTIIKEFRWLGELPVIGIPILKTNNLTTLGIRQAYYRKDEILPG
jgi:hypothetical protein